MDQISTGMFFFLVQLHFRERTINYYQFKYPDVHKIYGDLNLIKEENRNIFLRDNISQLDAFCAAWRCVGDSAGISVHRRKYSSEYTTLPARTHVTPVNLCVGVQVLHRMECNAFLSRPDQHVAPTKDVHR